MGIRSFLGMNMVVVLLVFLLIPTFAISKPVEISHEPNQPSLASPLSSPISPSPSPVPFGSRPSPGYGFRKLGKCPELVKGEMVDEVLDHLKVPHFMKSVLRKSAKFGVCIAENFCGCVVLKFEPLIVACFGEIGVKCMKDAISGRVYDCTTACAKSMIKANHKLSEEAIGDFCYSKCMKSV